MSSTLADKLRPFNPELPLERAHTIPASWYTDPEIYEAERRTVFGQGWLAAGRADQVRQPGSYFTVDIAGEPILVVRDGEGMLRAFYNVCRHRAARVMPEAAGRATKLRCPYHGWTYELTGRLIGVPEFDGVADFSREDNGLVPLAVAEWGPLVFCSPFAPRANAARGACGLLEFLAPLPEQTAGLGLESLRFAEWREYEVACNWKVFVDNYLDGGYHVNSVHPGLAGVLDYTHYRTTMAGNTSVQTSPLRAAGDDTKAVSKVRTGSTAYYWWVFPNLMLNIYDGLMDTNLVLPLGPDRCKVIFDFYFAKTEGTEAQHFIGESIAVAHQIQLEDGGICEDVQRGLSSRSYDTGRFSVRREIAGYHFHRLLAQRLQSFRG